jgi:hypothetical protein
MQTPPLNLSVIDPVGRALDRVKLLLFQPFDLGKWFVIGFCAWLAFLGEGGGGFHANFPFNWSDHRGRSLDREFEHARDYVLGNLHWIVPLVATLVVLGLVLGLVCAWLSSRGRFMFLHCVALNRAKVAEPWHQFAREGNSLFLFRLVVGVICLIVSLPLVVLCVGIGWRMFKAGEPALVGVLELVGMGLVFVLLAIVFALIGKLTRDFVVPLMYLRRQGCCACWSELLRLLGANAGDFILWLLFQIVLSFVIGMLVFAVVIATCCCAGCVMALPYLGTVLLLPVLVFKRAYALHYLAQFGPAFDVFVQAAPAAPAGGTAMMQPV